MDETSNYMHVYVNLKEFILSKCGEEIKQENVSKLFAYVSTGSTLISLCLEVLFFGMKGIMARRDFLKHFTFSI